MEPLSGPKNAVRPYFAVSLRKTGAALSPEGCPLPSCMRGPAPYDHLTPSSWRSSPCEPSKGAMVGPSASSPPLPWPADRPSSPTDSLTQYPPLTHRLLPSRGCLSLRSPPLAPIHRTRIAARVYRRICPIGASPLESIAAYVLSAHRR